MRNAVRRRDRTIPRSRSWCVAACTITLIGGSAARALAQDRASPVSGAPTPPLISAEPVSDPYAIFDPLRWKGLNIILPGPANTVDQGLFGIRQTLADAGIGYIGISNSSFEDNIIRHGLPAPAVGNRQNQAYNGQLPTYVTYDYLWLTYDLSRYGIPNGQFVLGSNIIRTNWNPLGPNLVGLCTLSYYQTLFRKAVEFKIGYLANNLEFLQTLVGGNIAGGVFGPNAAIITELGQNTSSHTTPGVNVTIHLPEHVYTKLGLQRALSPGGTVVEHDQNRYAVDFTVPKAGLNLIDEVGYKVDPSPGLLNTWIRAAGSYSSSIYSNYARPAGSGLQSDKNYGLFLLVDQQVWQSNPHVGTANQGVYLGFSAEYAPPSLNEFSQYYELRAYGFGLIPTRPADQISLVLADNIFSHYLVRSAVRDGNLAHRTSIATTLSYSLRVFRGAYVNLGISIVNHPTSVTYTSNTGSGLNILLGTVLFL